MTILERVARLSRRDLDTGCRIWQAGLTSDGTPRLTLRHAHSDARRAVYEAAHETRLPSRTRMTTTCGNPLCVATAHVTPLRNSQKAAA